MWICWSQRRPGGWWIPHRAGTGECAVGECAPLPALVGGAAGREGAAGGTDPGAELSGDGGAGDGEAGVVQWGGGEAVLGEVGVHH